mmetsp:Transcript_16154/g.45001  ORF Transcript_16154/g.45001 Transcript_16154/m.45001 type:complete len:1129 (-) Transcript_16154:189-3575(-)
MVLRTPSVAPTDALSRASNELPRTAGTSGEACRGGQFSRKPSTAASTAGDVTIGLGTDVLKAAESLFETRTVAEIRQVEVKTRRDIEEKKHSLRQLVGDSYRDLIASADTIMEMSAACTSVLQNVERMQEAFDSLSHTVSASKGAAIKPEETSKRQELYAIGSRIKYLVDTPEEIWGCLDTQEYLEAAWRYLKTVEVHRVLTNPSGGYSTSGLLHRFPLLRHQWPTVEKFRGQITDKVKHRLQTEPNLDVNEAAVALSAAASLEGLGSSQVLALFLGQRRAWLAHHLWSHGPTESSASGAASDFVTTVFQDVACSLQRSICEIGELFLRSPFEGTQPLLVTTICAEDDTMAGGLIFEGATGDGPSIEAAAWAELIKEIREKLGPLPPQQVEAATTAWLEQVAQTFQESSCALLGLCSTPEQLSCMEAAVRAAIKGWSTTTGSAQHPQGGTAKALSIGGSDLASMPSRKTSGASTAFEPPADAAAARTPMNWQGVCDWVVGRQMDLWELVFEAPFMARAKQLIDEMFATIGKALDDPLEQCMQEAAACPALEGPGRIMPATWPSHLPPQRMQDSLSRGQPSSQSLKRVATAGAAKDSLSWRQKIPILKSDFDLHLKEALLGCLSLLSDTSSASAPSGGRMEVHRSFNSNSRLSRKRTRVVELEPYIQGCCSKAAATLAETLESRLAALPHPGTQGLQAKQVEQALVLGRLATSLAEASAYLKVILGSPEDWYSLSSNPSSSSSSLRRDYLKRSSPQLAALQSKLSAIGLQAHGMWAAWAASALKDELQMGLLADDTLAATGKLCTWQETVLNQEESVAADGDMRFSLPTFPVAPTMSFLLNACRELQRAGGHMISSSALQLFEWELSGAMVAALGAVLEESSGPSPKKAVSEKGVLQLLFDVRYLRDVLSGARPAPPASSAAAAAGPGMVDPAVISAMSERKRAMVELESKLQDRLDPIDWATYEPYLWVNESNYYQRCASLVGSLGCLHPMHSNASAKLPSNAETNIMNVTPTVPRFSYLPISQPQAADKSKGLGRMSTGHVGLGSGSLDEAYSFADLGSRSLSNASAEPVDDGSTFADLRSRISTRGAALGSIFTDRAAEVASMASTFGDFGSISSAFSTFTSAGKR